jgi:outer membrane scaffolding protein for murein synthesis (MipA/OmpV family)
MELARDLNIGAQLAYEGGRLASESDFLRRNNVPDINPGASFGLHVEWDHTVGPVPVTLLARGRHFADSDRGAQADLRLAAGVFSRGAVNAGVFVQGTWADSKSNQSFYGVAGSGTLYASGGLLWGVDLGREWIVVGNLEARRLQGDAAHSPLAERRSNHYASASLAYRF